MSVWASMEAPAEDLHEDSCSGWDKEDGIWKMVIARCDCGRPDAPLRYYGSHRLPDAIGDERDGYVDIALLPRHVRHYAALPDSDDEPEGWEPFLRLGVNEGTVVLTERNVRMIYDTLTTWLEGLGCGSE